ncbi:MAG: hypothetical protein J6J42_09130 [Lachnospiraceae bacterium]|nr:hypothetical protein [Lachnospiraceae bacterium]
MTKNNSLMNYTFQRVSSFCGLRLSYYTTAVLLAVIFLLLAATRYKTASPLYILLVLAVLPSLLQSMLFPDNQKKKEKRENELPFPLFCKKYHYNTRSYKAMNLAYFFIFLLFAAWYMSYSLATGIPYLVRLLPVICALLCLAVRMLGTLGYRLYFHLFPLKAMR